MKFRTILLHIACTRILHTAELSGSNTREDIEMPRGGAGVCLLCMGGTIMSSVSAVGDHRTSVRNTDQTASSAVTTTHAEAVVGKID